MLARKVKMKNENGLQWTLRLLLLVKDASGGLHLLDKGIVYQRPMGLSACRIIAFP